MPSPSRGDLAAGPAFEEVASSGDALVNSLVNFVANHDPFDARRRSRASLRPANLVHPPPPRQSWLQKQGRAYLMAV